ncbi:hypothetical protein CXB51_025707 [Gossypium anomalum]|uniref:Uncharacterized protein n=1 Tax=Gossypium anomalum TaxID=47600 RepID=A0A8J5Y3J6_9ROSI|nr:hypothetical protein CXB51_025707 [Gossypium anomalum]
MATLGLLNAKAEPATCNAPVPAQAVIEGAVAEGERCSTIPSSSKGGQSSSREHKAGGAELYRQANNVIHWLMFELQINFIGNVQKSLILTKEQVTKLVIDWDIVDRLPMLKEQNSLQNIALELDASARNKADENAMKLAEDLKRLNEELHTRIVYLAWLKGDFECCQILIDKWEWETNKEQFMELAEDMKRQNEEFDNRIVEMERLKVEIQRQRIMEADENALKLAFTFKRAGDYQERLSIAEDELKIQRQRTMEANENAMKLAQDLKRQNEELRNRVVEVERLKGSAEQELETTKECISIAEEHIMRQNEELRNRVVEAEQLKGSAERKLETTKDIYLLLRASMINFGLIKELPEGFDPICPDDVTALGYEENTSNARRKVQQDILVLVHHLLSASLTNFGL